MYRGLEPDQHPADPPPFWVLAVILLVVSTVFSLAGCDSNSVAPVPDGCITTLHVSFEGTEMQQEPVKTWCPR